MVRAGWSGLALAALLVGTLAGCIQVTTPPAPSSTGFPDDGLTTIAITVVDASGGSALPDTSATLVVPGKGSVRKETDARGQATFTVQPAPACSLTLARAGYQGGGVSVDCRRDQAFRVPLRSLTLPRPTGSTGPGGGAAPLPTLQPGEVLLRGAILDAEAGEPLAGITVQLDAPNGPAQRTAADGLYAFATEPGPHTLTTDAPCWAAGTFPIEVAQDTVLDLRLSGDATPPGAPTGLRATGGPGPGMVAVAWDAVPGAAGYVLMRGADAGSATPLVRLGDSRAYGIHQAGASDRFFVAATNGCGFAGVPAGPVSAEPLPGTPLTPMSTSSAPFGADVSQKSYPVHAPNGSVVREAPWRTVLGTGNCCENHVVTSRDGLLVDIGADTVYVSPDEGRSWSRVTAPVPPLCGEGAGAAAPDGDLVMFDWVSCLPIMDDQVFAFKYSAATGRWYSQHFPLHSPFYDRPWMGVVKGPFEVEGMIVPYLTFAIGGYPSKEVMLVSLDGLHYVLPSSSSLDGLQGSVSLPALDLGPDTDRDWIQGTVNAGIAALDQGLGLRYDLSLLGDRHFLQDGLTWGTAQLAQASLPPGAIQADSRGTLHTVAMEGSSFRYSWSHDGGRTWRDLVQPVGGDAASWDFRAHAGFDQTVVSVHVQKADGDDAFRVFRFTGLAGDPTLLEVLEVGLADAAFRGALTGGGSRFDFQTISFLPTGKVVTSFGDSVHDTPALAIEL